MHGGERWRTGATEIWTILLNIPISLSNPTKVGLDTFRERKARGPTAARVPGKSQPTTHTLLGAHHDSTYCIEGAGASVAQLVLSANGHGKRAQSQGVCGTYLFSFSHPPLGQFFLTPEVGHRKHRRWRWRGHKHGRSAQSGGWQSRRGLRMPGADGALASSPWALGKPLVPRLDER